MERWLRYTRYASPAGATALALLFAFTAQGAAGDGRRLALVVGNAQYESVYSLRNPVNDAHAVTATLERLGFDVVSLDNAGREEFQTAVNDFSRMAEGAEATVFYFSGHGFQLKGANYLVPTDAKLTSTVSIDKETLRLDAIISELQSRHRQTLIFLDACRNNPLPEGMRDKDGGFGLAEVETGSGTFVAFATAPGSITRDGIGKNSPFTSALVEHMETPGISISDMMIRVRNEVEEATAHEQTPWDQSSLRSQFYFNPEGEGEDALTEEDRQLLMSLDPALRKKFEARFGLKIETVEEGGDDEGEELIATIVPAVTISAGGDDETGDQTAGQEAAAIVPRLVIADAGEPQHGTPDIVALPALRPVPPEPDTDVALLVPQETPPPLEEEAPAAAEAAAAEPVGGRPSGDPSPAQPPMQSGSGGASPAPAASQIDGMAEIPTRPEPAAEAVVEVPAVEPEVPVAETEAEAVAQAPADEPEVPVAEAEAPVPPEAEAEAVAQAPAAQPEVPVAEAEAPVTPEAEAEAVAQVPADEPEVPVAEAEAPVPPEAEAEAVAQVPADEPEVPVAGAEAPVPQEAEAEAVAQVPADEPEVPVAEAETPPVPEAEAEVVAQVPAAQPEVPVAEAEAPVLPEAVAAAEPPMAIGMEPGNTAMAEEQRRPALVPVEAAPEPETVAMLGAPAFEPPVRGTEGSRALPPVAEDASAPVQPDGSATMPGLPRLFPADGAKAELPAAAAAAPDTETVEPERQMAALAPSETRPELLPPTPEAEAEATVDMPRAIQEELARLGCYRSTIDGDWGPKSAKALLRYYATKKEAPDELDPNEMLLAKLSREEKVVCTRTESDRTVTKKKGGGETTAKKPVKPAPVAKKPAKQAPVAKKPATRSKVVRTPAPARPKPAPKVATEERKRKLGLGTGAFR